MNIFLTRLFEKPENLRLMVLLPIIILIFIAHFRKHYPLINKMLRRNAPEERGLFKKAGLLGRYILSCLFFALFIICISISLSEPRAGKRFVRDFHRGADVVLAFDISRSMEARDISLNAKLPHPSPLQAPSRLERAAELAEALALSSMTPAGTGNPALIMPADIHIRFAAALGKGGRHLALPLTSDTEALFALLSALSSGLSSSRGTDLERLLDAALGAFDDAFATEKIIILFSDGEALSGTLQLAAERVKEREARLYTVGLGSEDGVKLSGIAPEEAVSFLHADSLIAAARIAEGEYIDGNSPDAAAKLLHIIENTGRSSWTYRQETIPVWHLFLLAAIASLLASRLCAIRPLQHPGEAFAKPLPPGTNSSEK